jgi:hypothetical protein
MSTSQSELTIGQPCCHKQTLNCLQFRMALPISSRTIVDCSPLISCEGVRERHLSSYNANRQWESVQNSKDSLRALKLVDRSDPAVTLVAKRVIALAMGGERDPILLREAVLQSFRNDPGASGL